jgi:hypothetical protein
MTADMSTSLKVVSMAAVFCASTRRRAMVRRSAASGHHLAHLLLPAGHEHGGDGLADPGITTSTMTHSGLDC